MGKFNINDRYPIKVTIADVMGFAEYLSKDLKNTLDKSEVRSVKEVFSPLVDNEKDEITLEAYNSHFNGKYFKEDAIRIFTKTDSQLEAYLKKETVKWFQSISRKETA